MAFEPESPPVVPAWKRQWLNMNRDRSSSRFGAVPLLMPAWAVAGVATALLAGLTAWLAWSSRALTRETGQDIRAAWTYPSAAASSLASTWTACGSVIVTCPSRPMMRRALMIVTPITSPLAS